MRKNILIYFSPSDSVLSFSEQRGSVLQSFKKDLFLTFWRNLSFTSIGASCDLTRVALPLLKIPTTPPKANKTTQNTSNMILRRVILATLLISIGVCSCSYNYIRDMY